MSSNEHDSPQSAADALSTGALVQEIAQLAANKKASAIVELDLRQFVTFADSFLICTGNNERQTKAIADAIAEGVRERLALKPRRVEGLTQANWILLDYLDVVVHIFTPATRDFYRLESLWGEAPVRNIEPDDAAAELTAPVAFGEPSPPIVSARESAVESEAESIAEPQPLGQMS